MESRLNRSDDAWLQGLLNRPSQHWVSNVECHLDVFGCQDFVFPATVNYTEWNNSYVCSPYTAFVSYAREELAKLKSPLLEKALGHLITGLALLLRKANINRVVHINNWLLSTNLYPNWKGEGAETLHQSLRKKYPDHVLIFRSLNQKTNSELLKRLGQLGYRLLPSRQVYMFDARRSNLRQPKNYQRDIDLLHKTNYQVVTHQEFLESDFPRVVDLYNQLYLDKYSQHNPAFSESLIRLWHQHGILQMTGLRGSSGRLEGVVGIWERDGITTVPLVGYEMSIPQTIGLYRMLMAIAIEDAHRRSILLNLSAGAAHFKRLRGGEPELEYSAVYYAHLPWSKAVAWRVLDLLLSNLAAPLMRYFQL